MNYKLKEGKYIEYSKGSVPILNNIKPKVIYYGDQIISPNLKAEYIVLNNSVYNDNLTDGSSHEYFVLEGSGKTIIETKPLIEIKWSKGDVFILPFINEEVRHISFEKNSILFTANDIPLLNYLKSRPFESKFSPTLFKNSDIITEINKYSKEKESKKRNRNGVLLTSDEMISENLNTISHTMWSLYNILPPNSIQPPHKHNSIAIDLCVDVDEKSSKEGLIYTLMGPEIKNNKIVNPIKIVWKKNHAFVTPPGWWHSHHNESNISASVFPVQDAGLHTYMETLDINFLKY